MSGGSTNITPGNGHDQQVLGAPGSSGLSGVETGPVVIRSQEATARWRTRPLCLALSKDILVSGEEMEMHILQKR